MERVYLKSHHIRPLYIMFDSIMSETAIFRCPHCRKQITMIANSEEGSDTIIISFGREWEALEEELKKELEDRFRE